MKLNKILALALTGVMAVSMLAGCGNKDTGNGDGDVVVTPSVTTAVTVMNDEQSLVKFESDSAFDAMLAAAAKKAKFDDVKAAEYKVTVPVADTDGVYVELAKKLPAGDTIQSTGTKITFAGVGKKGEKNNKTALFVVESNGLTEKAALEQIADLMQDAEYPTIVVDTDKYEASYTGKVSIVSVECNDGGNAETAYYIAVSVTQTVGRDKVV